MGKEATLANDASRTLIIRYDVAQLPRCYGARWCAFVAVTSSLILPCMVWAQGILNFLEILTCPPACR
jgi:hypothetical protein